jgi:predicted  nucleic acid-binding Zn-ribbon protein
MNMNNTLSDLIRLQELTLESESEGHEAILRKRIDRLRAKLPETVLRRFDHLAEHGRRAVARVSQSGACGSCHLKLTRGDVLRLRHTCEEAVPACPYCGCFLYAADTVSEPNETIAAAS